MPKLPAMQGLIRRRLLINFRVEPEVMARHLPTPFRPKLHKGYAIAGICLIRLEAMRPKGLGLPVGLSSENAAHRAAVCWTDPQGERAEGVFIPRRDTDSRTNHLAGGRLFPGEHHLSRFTVQESGPAISLQMASVDGAVSVDLQGCRTDEWAPHSLFATLQEASDFFERGCIGYSACADAQRFDGLLLRTPVWSVRPLAVQQLASSYFTNPALFPPGSVAFDCALIMEQTAHEWIPLAPLRSET